MQHVDILKRFAQFVFIRNVAGKQVASCIVESGITSLGSDVMQTMNQLVCAGTLFVGSALH